MNRGYIFARCTRCGSVSELEAASVRSEGSLCPVCLEGEIICRTEYTDASMTSEIAERIRKLEPYSPDRIRYEAN